MARRARWLRGLGEWPSVMVSCSTGGGGGGGNSIVAVAREAGRRRLSRGRGERGWGEKERRVWVYEHLEGIILRLTGHVTIPRMFCWHDKHVPSLPEATLELLSLVKTHEIVELYPSIDETEKLLRSTPAPQLELHKESEDEDAERNEDELKEEDAKRKDAVHVVEEAKDG
ncbi:hypothetical protein Droror1_Dr00016347 [Drosera rotundifolia]